MKLKPVTIAATTAAALSAADYAGAESPAVMQAGKWRSTTQFSQVDMPGLPPQVSGMVAKQMGRGQSFEYCLKPEDVRQPGPNAMGGKNARDCEYEEWSYSQGRMHAVLVCNVKGQGRLRQVMDGTGSSTGYAARVETTIIGGKMGPIHMKGRVTGQRIGGC